MRIPWEGKDVYISNRWSKDVTLLRFSSTTRFLANAGGARILTRDETQWFTPRRVRQQWSIKREANEVLCFVFLQYDTLALYSGPKSTLLIGLSLFCFVFTAVVPSRLPSHRRQQQQQFSCAESSNSLACLNVVPFHWDQRELNCNSHTRIRSTQHRTHHWTVIQYDLGRESIAI